MLEWDRMYSVIKWYTRQEVEAIIKNPPHYRQTLSHIISTKDAHEHDLFGAIFLTTIIKCGKEIFRSKLWSTP
jgi:hypothetical protein